MFTLMIILFMMTINSMLVMMIHPLSITLMIIMQTLLICLISGPISYSFWFSYILFLIFLGGMLVLFIYITSLASNEMFQLPTKTMLTSLMLTIILLIPLTTLNKFFPSLMYKYDSLNNNMMFMSTENNLNQLYNYPNFMLTILTILYLLLTLIIIVKITYIQEGPLRHSN